MQLQYLEAQKRAFPYAKAKVGGPYTSFEEAMTARPTVAAQHPDCNISLVRVNVAMKKAALLLNSPKIEERTK